MATVRRQTLIPIMTNHVPLNQLQAKAIQVKHVTIKRRLGFQNPLPCFKSYQLGRKKHMQQYPINLWFVSTSLAENVNP